MFFVAWHGIFKPFFIIFTAILHCWTAEDEVFVFDSMYASVSTKVKHQIAALLATQSKTIKLSFIDVLKQSGGYDCGLFALAFATALVNGSTCTTRET